MIWGRYAPRIAAPLKPSISEALIAVYCDSLDGASLAPAPGGHPAALEGKPGYLWARKSVTMVE